jgi:hypothetical protein
VLDPFGEKPTPWWQREWWQGWLWSSQTTVPKRYSRPVAAVSALVAFATVGEQLDLPAKIAVGVFAMGIPSILLERRWRQRRRYQAEQLLFLLPDTSDPGRS